MSNKFLVPNVTFIGSGALDQAESSIVNLGKKALIVTGDFLVEQGHMSALTEKLEKANVEYVFFTDILTEPTDVIVENGIKVYKENNCDFQIAFGGGSILDTAKAIGVMVVNYGAISDFNGVEITKPTPPLVAIPTTSGTGSETTSVTIITDTKNDIKMRLFGDVLIPTIAVVDPQFTMGMPKGVTASTGLDALTHAVEAFTSRLAFDISDMFALSAVKRIFKYLPIVYKDGSDVLAREEMSKAAFEAGVAFSNASVTIVHGMSRPIGALFHVAHGISNAMLLKECLTYVVDGAYSKFAILGREIGVATLEDSDESAALKFIDAIDELCKVCEIPTLVEYGIDKEEFISQIDKMSKDAFDSGSPSTTMKELTVEDLKIVYRKLIEQ